MSKFIIADLTDELGREIFAEDSEQAKQIYIDYLSKLFRRDKNLPNTTVEERFKSGELVILYCGDPINPKDS